MAEPVTFASFLKTAGEFFISLWERGALLLWCAATAGVVVLIALLIGSHWHLGNSEAFLVRYGTELVLSTLVLVVFAGFKSYGERARQRSLQPIVLIADEQFSHWNQAKQPTGQTITAISLRFQVFNRSDGAVKLSGIRLRRPWVRRSRIMQTMLSVQHPKHSAHYSPEYPILPHSVGHASAHIVIDHPVGPVNRPTRVVIRIQDHQSRWQRIVFPHVRWIGPLLDPKN
jgi:hypothetical protein